jgi:hypothetical protein
MKTISEHSENETNNSTNDRTEQAPYSKSDVVMLPDISPEVTPVSYDDQKKHAKSLNDEQLCDFLERTFAPVKRAIAYNLPYLAEARMRFMQQGRRVPVCGQLSWTEWISNNLGISDRQVRRLLAQYRIETGQQPVAEPGKPKSSLRTKKVLPATFAKKGVKLAKLVLEGDFEAAKQLAAAMLDEEKNVKTAPVAASAPALPCRGCKDLHSGIAEVLKGSPDKTIDTVACECGVSPVVVRQAATRYGLTPSVMSPSAQVECHVA